MKYNEANGKNAMENPFSKGALIKYSFQWLKKGINSFSELSVFYGLFTIYNFYLDHFSFYPSANTHEEKIICLQVFQFICGFARPKRGRVGRIPDKIILCTLKVNRLLNFYYISFRLTCHFAGE